MFWKLIKLCGINLIEIYPNIFTGIAGKHANAALVKDMKVWKDFKAEHSKVRMHSAAAMMAMGEQAMRPSYCARASCRVC